MNDNNENLDVGFTVMIVLVSLLAVLIIGAAFGESFSRTKAVEANVGRYVVDATNGSTVFVYGVVSTNK